MSATTIGVAVIGAGMVGRAHAAGFRAAPTVYGPGLPEVRLVAVSDLDANLASEAARRFGYARVETDWHAVAAAPDVDVVVVAVANPLHREIVVGLLEAGKHVLCEKPLAPSLDDAEAMVRAAAASGTHTAVGFSFRRTPAIAAIRAQLLDGALGDPVHLDARYWCDYGSDPRGPISWRYKGGPGSGALADIGSHVVDVAEFVCGPVRAVRGAVLATAVGERPVPLGVAVGHAATEVSDVLEPVENEDSVSFTAIFESGATGTLSASRIAHGHANSLGFELFGQRGSARFDLDRPGEFEFADATPPTLTNGRRQVLVRPGHPYFTGGLPMDFPGVSHGQNDLFVWQARAFLEQVAGIEGLPRTPSFEYGMHNLAVLRAVVESSRAHGAEVRLDQVPAGAGPSGKDSTP